MHALKLKMYVAQERLACACSINISKTLAALTQSPSSLTLGGRKEGRKERRKEDHPQKMQGGMQIILGISHLAPLKSLARQEHVCDSNNCCNPPRTVIGCGPFLL